MDRTNWNEMSDFERRSCATKRRFKSEPPLPSMAFRAYPCDFCGGWHLASRYKPRKTEQRVER